MRSETSGAPHNLYNSDLRENDVLHADLKGQNEEIIIEVLNPNL